MHGAVGQRRGTGGLGCVVPGRGDALRWEASAGSAKAQQLEELQQLQTLGLEWGEHDLDYHEDLPADRLSWAWLQGLPNLTKLEVNTGAYEEGARGDPLEEPTTMAMIGQVPGLLRLTLGGVNFKDADMADLAPLKSLTHLHLSSCFRLTDTALENLKTSLESLTELELDRCEGFTEAGLNKVQHVLPGPYWNYLPTPSSSYDPYLPSGSYDGLSYGIASSPSSSWDSIDDDGGFHHDDH